MKSTKLFISIIVFLLLLNIVIASAPSYLITVELKNRNIEIGNKLNYTVYIRGGGECSRAFYRVSTEGIMVLENYYIAGSVNQSIPNPLAQEGEAETYCYSKNKFISEKTKNLPLESGQIRTEIIDLFNRTGYIEVENVGTMRPRNNSTGGIYNLNVVLSCLNNGQLYNFNANAEFRVLLQGEYQQYQVAQLSLIVAIISLGLSAYAIGKNKKI